MTEQKNEEDRKQILLPDGSYMPRLGQGTWQMAEDDTQREREIRGLQYGIQKGITMIDSAEMYAGGKAEGLAGEAIAGLGKTAGTERSDLYLVSKVLPENAGRKRMFSSAHRSLKLLGTDYLDLYLLHWRGDTDLSEAVWCMEKLREEGKIRRWGVSNFDVKDMEDLMKVPDGRNCCVNQVLYNLGTRGIEYDLIPWQRERGIPFMAYSPVGQAGALVTQDGVSKAAMMNDKNVKEVAQRRKISVVQLLLAFVLRLGDFAAIPKAVGLSHIDENAEALNITLTEEEVEQLSESFPAPDAKIAMEKY